MKRIKKMVAIFLIACVGLGGVFFPYPDNVEAATHDNVITKLYIKDENGGELTSPIGVWRNFRVYAEFKLPDNKVHANDTTTITLPDALLFGNQSPTFEIRDNKNNLVANAVCDAGSKTIKLTYTDYVDNHSDVSGELFFYARVDHSKIKDEKDIELNFEVEHKVIYGGKIHYEGIGKANPYEIRKSGWQISAKNGYLGYGININEKKMEMKDVKFEDRLQTDSTSYVKDSLKVLKGKWIEENGEFKLKDEVDVTGSYAAVWNPDGKSFSIKLGNLSSEDAIRIYYEVKVDYNPADGEVFGNKARLNTHDKVFESGDLDLKYLVAGGSAEGYIYKIKIKKVSEDGNSPLKGAKFKVIRVANNKQVRIIDTNESGDAEVGGLLKDEYIIEEINPPQGYEKLREPIKVSKTDFDTNKVALKTIKNKKRETSVKVTKRWEDKENQDGKRPNNIKVQLYAGDDKVGNEETLDETNQWTKTWNNLPEMKEGKKIKYTVKEVGKTEGYETEVDDSNPGNIIITNSHTPEETEIKGEKTWNDGDNQDGKRPTEIKVNLLENGTPVKTETVKAGNDGKWKYEFKNLPVYKNGKKITYTVTEDVVKDYNVKINGFDIENSYTPKETSATVTKKWEDKENQDGKRPDSIKVQLYADDEKKGEEEELSEANQWTKTWNNLPEMKAGKKIKYTVKEVGKTEGYKTEVDDSNLGNVIITNSHTPEVTKIAGKKTWNDKDNQDGFRPSKINVRLLADGEEVDKKEVTEEDDWKYEFADKPVYKAGKKITYTVEEEKVEKYTPKYEGYDIENSYTPESTYVKVNKVWKDNDDKDGIRPDSIKVQLYADGEKLGKEITLNKGNKWTHTWDKLDKKKDGKIIKYTAKEVDVPKGYEMNITAKDASNMTITNSHNVVPKTGDNTNILIYGLAAIVSLLALIVAVLYRRKLS